ncbi:CIS tube protein, partial [Pseudorhodoferax aquiterrae]
MAWLPDAPTVASATFKVLDGPGAGGAPFVLQFNPASLEYTVSNEFDDRNGNNGARQFVKKSSGKLSMTLVFDTTETGVSVRDVTAHISGLLEPAKDGSKKFAPKVEFGWGSYRFRGVVEQFKETLDFFSAEGVPLRSSIALTLASQEVEFQSNRSPAPPVDRSLPADPVRAAPGAGAASVANALGDPRAARAIASANASASLRFGAEAGLSVGGSVTLSAAADFSAGAGAGLSIGAGAGVGIGASAGAGLSVGAALTATAGPAFAGLSIAPPSVSVDLGAARASLLPAPPVAGAAFGPGGRAV